jgi:hypothetical protein
MNSETIVMWIALAAIVCVALIAFGVWCATDTTYTRQISYFVMDGNTIDLGYESVRWQRVLFFDVNGETIGDFTKVK